jgi:hypothetical protein
MFSRAEVLVDVVLGHADAGTRHAPQRSSL